MSRKRRLTEQAVAVLSPETHKKLKEVTDKLEVSVSEFIREIIEEKLSEFINN